MIQEHDTVALTRDLPEHGLIAGDLVVVVFVHEAGAYEVEVFTADGRTLDVITVPADAVRPGAASEVPHARSIAAE